MQGMRIGAAARAAGVSVETVRYYERAGLLTQPHRPSFGYRGYPADAVERIQYIKRAQRLGFTLTEIRDLLTLQFETYLTCDDLTRRASAKVAEIEERISALQSLKVGLENLVGRCGVECSGSCTVLIEIEPIVPSAARAGGAPLETDSA